MNRKKIVPVVVAGLVSGLLTAAVMISLTSHAHSDAPAKLEMLHIFPSVALWLIFFGYWGIAGRNAAPTESSESSGSTQFHQVGLGLTLLLLILPFPGLTARYLPDSNLTLALGLMIQAGFVLLAIWARRHLGRNRFGTEYDNYRRGSWALVPLVF